MFGYSYEVTDQAISLYFKCPPVYPLIYLSFYLSDWIYFYLVVNLSVYLSGSYPFSVLEAYTRTISQFSLAHHSAEREIILG